MNGSSQPIRSSYLGLPQDLIMLSHPSGFPRLRLAILHDILPSPYGVSQKCHQGKGKSQAQVKMWQGVVRVPTRRHLQQKSPNASSVANSAPKIFYEMSIYNDTSDYV